MGVALLSARAYPLWFFLLLPTMYNVPRTLRGLLRYNRDLLHNKIFLLYYSTTTVSYASLRLQYVENPTTERRPPFSQVSLSLSLSLSLSEPSPPPPSSFLSVSLLHSIFSPPHGGQVRATHVLDSLVVELARAGASSNRPLKLADIWQSRFSGGAASK